MKKLIRILSVCLVVCLIGAMFAIFTTANTDNYITLSAKYSSSTNKLLAPQGVIKTAGFTYTENDQHGIDVHIPDMNEFSGVDPVAAVSYKNKTPLAGLSVQLSFDKEKASYKKCPTENNAYANISVLWSQNEKTSVSDLTLNGNKVTGGNRLFYGGDAISNGLRHLCLETEKAVCVSVMNNNQYNEDTLTASTLYVTIIDGNFVDRIDSRPGFRWSFTARNDPMGIGTQGDACDIAKSFLNIDLSNGLFVNFREDTTLGYVVIVNGVEYSKGSDVANFPNDLGGNGWGQTFLSTDYGVVTDEDGVPIGTCEPTQNYTRSMTYSRKDINFNQINYCVATEDPTTKVVTFTDKVSNALSDVTEGYLTVGVVGNSNIDPHFDYTIESINGVPAAEWTGTPIDHTHNIENACVKSWCTICGAHFNDSSLSHSWVVDNDSFKNCGYNLEITCDETPTVIADNMITDEPALLSTDDSTGLFVNDNDVIKAQNAPVDTTETGRNFLGWSTATGAIAPNYELGDEIPAEVTEVYGVWQAPVTDDSIIVATTCAANGTYTHTCSECNYSEEVTVPALPHTFGEWTVTKAPTTTEEGAQTRTCIICGFVEDGVIEKLPSDNPTKPNNNNNSNNTTKPAKTTPNKTSGNAAQTFDAGVAIAIGGVVASGAGILSFKRKKK